MFTILLVGCSGDNSTARVAQLNKSNIQKVSNLCVAFASSSGGVGPKDAAELKNFVTKGLIPQRRLDMMLIDPKNLDAIFVSERDGQPIKIRAKAPVNPFSVSAVAFEEKGIDGKRQVGFTDSTVKEVDDAQYNELWQGKGTESQPSGSEATKTGGG